MGGISMSSFTPLVDGNTLSSHVYFYSLGGVADLGGFAYILIRDTVHVLIFSKENVIILLHFHEIMHMST